MLPISAHTGYGLDKLRAALVSTLGRESGSSAGSPTIENDLTQNKGLEEKEDQTPVDKDSLAFGSGDRGSERTGVSVVEAPEGAATGTVLDYVSSAKTGKMLVSKIPWFPFSCGSCQYRLCFTHLAVTVNAPDVIPT